MKVRINNKEVETVATTILQLLEELCLPLHGVAVAVDNRMVARQYWDSFALEEGMNLVVIKAACGG